MQDQNETDECSQSSVQTWLSVSLNMEPRIEVPWVLPIWQEDSESPLKESGHVPISWDAPEVYKRRWMYENEGVDYVMKPPRQCPKPGCRATQPCQTHPQGWQNKDPSIRPLPPNWAQLKKMVPKTGGCWWLTDGVRCGIFYRLELDHRIPRSAGGTDSLANLGWLCQPHHRIKTEQDKKKYRR